MAVLHVTLPEALFLDLEREAGRAGVPAADIVRDVVSAWLHSRARARLSDDIAAFARAEAGGDLDLDAELEDAGAEVLFAARLLA